MHIESSEEEETAENSEVSDAEIPIEKKQIKEVLKGVEFKKPKLLHREKTAGCLSSIEIVYTYKTELFLMQNWEHLIDVWNALNKIPFSAKSSNIFRVREFALEGQSHFYRQNIMLSAFSHSNINSLFSSSTNLSGQCKVKGYFSLGEFGSLLKNVKNVFLRFEANTIKDSYWKRQTFFTKNILERQILSDNSHNLIFVSHYFDFVWLRNYLSKKEVSFDFCSEHSTIADNSRAKNGFKEGNIRFLIITERFHFFRRLKIRGIKNLIFFDLPLNSHYYSELVNMMDPTNHDLNVTSLFCKYDSNRLERIVGTERKKRFLSSAKDSFLCVD